MVRAVAGQEAKQSSRQAPFSCACSMRKEQKKMTMTYDGKNRHFAGGQLVVWCLGRFFFPLPPSGAVSGQVQQNGRFFPVCLFCLLRIGGEV